MGDGKVMVVNLVVMVLYFAITIGIGLYFGRKKTESSSDYTVGGRSFGWVLLFFTMMATIVGASSVMGATSYWANRGMGQMWFWLGGTIANLLYLFYLAPKINNFGREHGGETIGDWFEFRYGKLSKYLASIFIALAYIAITAFQYLAMAVILSLVTGLNQTLCLVITAVIVVIYTSLGGLWSVVSTDVLQGAMTWLGVVTLGIVFLIRDGGTGNIFANLPPEKLQFFGTVTPWNAFASMLTLGLGIVSWPDIWQRIYAAKNSRTFQKSYALYIVANLALTAAVMFLGFASLGLMPDYKGSANNLLPLMIMQYLPGIFGAILLAALMAVIMGTSDSCLLISGIIVSKDLIEPFLKGKRTDEETMRLRKIVTAITGIATLAVLLFSTDMFTLWVMSADITGATLAWPILLGFVWKKPRQSANVASIIAGFAGWLLFTIWPNLLSIQISAILPGALFSLIAYVIAAAVDPDKPLKAVKA